MSNRFLTLAAAFLSTLAVAACTEQLDGGSGCPLLCPQNPVAIRDTVIEGIAVDSSLAGFPPTGYETALLLANRGDTLETRTIFRFDSLPATYRVGSAAADSVIARVDSAMLVVRLIYPVAQPTVPVTVDAFDVDTLLPAASLADTLATTLAPLFRPGRLLGTVTVAPGSLPDSTLRIPLSSAALLGKITRGERLRIGLAVRGSTPASLVLVGQGTASTLSVRFRVSTDTTVAPVTVLPRSRTPDDEFTAPALADYQIVVRGATNLPAGTLGVGGLPARRTYFRFDLPRDITDSTRIVRAALLLTQRPNRASAARSDSVTIYPDIVVTGNAVTNLQRAVLFTSRGFGPAGTMLDSLRLAPADSGQRVIEIASLVAAWRSIAGDSVPRAIVLRSAEESTAAGAVLFFSKEAGDARVRPRLRLSYVPQIDFGLPR